MVANPHHKKHSKVSNHPMHSAGPEAKTGSSHGVTFGYGNGYYGGFYPTNGFNNVNSDPDHDGDNDITSPDVNGVEPT